MDNRKTLSEKDFQERFVEELTKYKWEAPAYLDGNKQKVTVKDLIIHWRFELNRINADRLEGVELTDYEFGQVITKVNQIANSYEAAKVLSMEGSIGKIDGIYREANPRVTQEQITLTIFKKAQVSGGDSSYKIAREVVTDRGNRFDIVMLINGLPLINIEQKRADKTILEAFNQFKRYYREGEYINNFMAFSQMMVITSDIATKYFATPKSLNEFNQSFVFNWADKNNRPINDWKEVASSLLRIPMAHQLVGDYLIIDEAEDAEERRHMIMRPYQVYALQSVEGAALGWNEGGIPHGGYVWHTTGSGKTVTSFKTALFLSTRLGFDKVVFLVDRKDLDLKTSTNFKAYASYESVSVNDTNHTYQLRNQLTNDRRGIVITTTHKLSALVKEYVENDNYKLAKKKMVFIVDEAHRTTMGTMMSSIKTYFKKNSLFYGYTGTPLFEENKATGMINEKSELIDTTEKLFGKELHRYTIDEAIQDGNVLGFHIKYINTGEFESHVELRERIIEKRAEEKPDLKAKSIELEVFSLSDAEVEIEANKREILVYHDKTHIPAVVTEILANWEDQSQKREFNAILTVAYKDRVVDYYKEFKKQLEGSIDTINIAMTFSFGGDEEMGEVPFDAIDMMFDDYSKFTNIRFAYGDSKRGENAYFEDLVHRSTRGGSGRSKSNIDLIIVAEQMLTGYDSKYLNTLYVDRELGLQALIQAYSRTNRIYGKNKEFGTIINFLFPKKTEEAVKKALKLYGSGGESSLAIVDQYSVASGKFASLVKIMRQILANPAEWKLLETKTEKKKMFMDSFLATNAQYNTVMQYYEYKWDDISFGIDEYTWFMYIGAYKNLYSKDKPEETDTIISIGKTRLAGAQVIDASYILALIGKSVIKEKGIQTVDKETLRIVYEQIQELSNMGHDNQAELLREFVDTELVPGKITSDKDFDILFNDWKKNKIDNDIEDFCSEWGIVDRELLAKALRHYFLRDEFFTYAQELTKNIDFSKALNKSAKNAMVHKMTLLKDVLPKWFAQTKQKYDYFI